jgi:hypothetical protein
LGRSPGYIRRVEARTATLPRSSLLSLARARSRSPPLLNKFWKDLIYLRLLSVLCSDGEDEKCPDEYLQR